MGVAKRHIVFVVSLCGGCWDTCIGICLRPLTSAETPNVGADHRMPKTTSSLINAHKSFNTSSTTYSTTGEHGTRCTRARCNNFKRGRRLAAIGFKGFWKRVPSISRLVSLV